MNFSNLLLNDEYTGIIIPRLQRDYAQGREDNNAREIRDVLLEDIFTNESITLNIVFGERKDGTFIPVDGQQRLTTLFLLYLYRNKLCEDNVNLNLNKFSYETRQSTIDFISRLIAHEWDRNKIKEGLKISRWIKAQGWFIWPWQYDPTVCGMLNMLDAIQEKERKYERFPDLDRIEFDFLDMGEMGLNETLYLKMNSRGKQLSAYEKIKSGMDEIVGEVKNIEAVQIFPLTGVPVDSFSASWHWQIDRDWSNWFWDKDNPLNQDLNFLALIQAYATSFYISKTHLSPNNNNEYSRNEVLSELQCAPSALSWKKLRAVIEKEPEKNKTEISADLRDEFFTGLAKLLERLRKTDGTFSTAWGETFAINRPDIKKSPDLKLTAFVWALSSFKSKEFEGVEFASWLRFIFNMIYNTVDSFDSLVRFVKRCSKYYAPKSDNILPWLANKPREVDDKSDQWAEECDKARFFINSEDRETAQLILKAEAHPLLRGRIRPVLLVSEDNTIDADRIKKRWEVFIEYFDSQKAVGNVADTFRTIFSYCNFWTDLNWWHYVFNNSETIWRERLLSQKFYTAGIFHLLNGESMTQFSDNTPVELVTLCSPGVMEKVLEMNNDDLYIRNPDYSIRPYGNLDNGIRLNQGGVLLSVRRLLEIPGVDFEKKDYKQFYEETGKVWGVRIRFSYRGIIFTLWDDFRLNYKGEWIKDESGNQIKATDDHVDLEKYLKSMLCS